MVGKGFEELAVAEIVRVVLQLGHPHSDKDQVPQIEQEPTSADKIGDMMDQACFVRV